MAHADFFDFLAESMDVLRREADGQFAELARILEGLTGKVVTEDGARFVRFIDGRYEQFEHHAGRIDIELVFDNQLVLDLVDGRLAFEEAIDRELLQVRGGVEAVERYHQGLTAFVSGAIRAPAFSALLARFRIRSASANCARAI